MRRESIIANPVMWKTRIAAASLPTGMLSQTGIRRRRMAAGAFQRSEMSIPDISAEIAGLRGLKGPKI